jgi:hypothetical protein
MRGCPATIGRDDLERQVGRLVVWAGLLPRGLDVAAVVTSGRVGHGRDWPEAAAAVGGCVVHHGRGGAAGSALVDERRAGDLARCGT